MIYAETNLEDMPESCYACPYGMKIDKYWDTDKKEWIKANNLGYNCALTMKAMTSTKRNRFCPLIQDWLIESEVE